MSRLIPLTSGKFAIVDDSDYERVAAFRWHYVPREGIASPDGGYAQCRYKNEDGQKRTIYMHRFILNAPADMDVDHRDGYTLTNTRGNLRLATSTQNMQNQAKTRVTCTSKYKGVALYLMKGRRTKGQPRWRAYINVNGKRIDLGYHSSELDAARAYDQAAILHFGEFARLNFPMEAAA